MSAAALDRRIATVRRFNRFYTTKIGVLQQPWLHTPFSLTEARVLYELAHRDGATASWLAEELGLDPGYLSRILRGFLRQRLIARAPAPHDGRQSLISLTPEGREAFAPLDHASYSEVVALLAPLPDAEQERLVSAMRTVSSLLGDGPERSPAFILRPHRAGDMGWVTHRHGVLYGEEYGLNAMMEAYVAEVVARFLREFDPARERCWIADQAGVPIGSVFIVKESDTTARLRLLLVEPKARGLGVGHALVDECVRFARQAGYREITLWTHSILIAARRIYAAKGFRIVETEDHDDFGPELTGETWSLQL